VASAKSQKIYRYDAAAQSPMLYFQSSVKYETYWRNDIDQPSKWYSDKPFLLVQFHNSKLYPDNVTDSLGEPCEIVVPAVEQFSKNLLFQLPAPIGTQKPFIHY